jgi:hypothetical protein
MRGYRIASLVLVVFALLTISACGNDSSGPVALFSRTVFAGYLQSRWKASQLPRAACGREQAVLPPGAQIDNDMARSRLGNTYFQLR